MHTKRVLATGVLHGFSKAALHTRCLFKRARPLGVDPLCGVQPRLLLGCQGDIWPCLVAVPAEHDALGDIKVRVVLLQSGGVERGCTHQGCCVGNERSCWRGGACRALRGARQRS